MPESEAIRLYREVNSKFSIRISASTILEVIEGLLLESPGKKPCLDDIEKTINLDMTDKSKRKNRIGHGLRQATTKAGCRVEVEELNHERAALESMIADVKPMSNLLQRKSPYVDMVTMTSYVVRQPNNVYVGVPGHLKHRVNWVEQEYRTNHLSLYPGGYDVIVEYHNGQVMGYDRIKDPYAYIRTFFVGGIQYSYDVSNILNEDKKARSVVSHFYAGIHGSGRYEEIWSSSSSSSSLRDAIRDFRRRN